MGATVDVSISGSGFNPDPIGIESGDLIRFTNLGPGPHEARIMYPGGSIAFQVGPLLPGESSTLGPFGQTWNYGVYDSFGAHTSTLTVSGTLTEAYVPVRFEVTYCEGPVQGSCRTYGGTVAADGQLIPDPGWPQPVACSTDPSVGGILVPPMAQMVEQDWVTSWADGPCFAATTQYKDLKCFMDTDHILRIARKVEGGLEFPLPLCFRAFKVWVDQSADTALSQRLSSDPCSMPDRFTLLPDTIQQQAALLLTALDISKYECQTTTFDEDGNIDVRGSQGPSAADGLCVIGLFQ